MNGIEIALDPVAFWIGDFAIRWYGIAVSAAILVGFSVTLREATRRGFGEDQVYSLGLWAVLFGIIGARLFHVIDYWAYYSANPWAMLALREGGLSIYGALLGGIAAGGVYAWRAKVPFRRLLDAAAPALLLAQATGRIGNIFNGDVQGRATDLPWAFYYTHPDALAPEPGVPGHPYPIYEIIWNLLSFAVVWSLRHRTRTPGVLFLVYVALYSAGRFTLMFVRHGTVVAWGLQQSQVIALLGFFAALGLIAYLEGPWRATADNKQKA